MDKYLPHRDLTRGVIKCAWGDKGASCRPCIPVVPPLVVPNTRTPPKPAPSGLWRAAPGVCAVLQELDQPLQPDEAGGTAPVPRNF